MSVAILAQGQYVLVQACRDVLLRVYFFFVCLLLYVAIDVGAL